ncbi:hypothetical protein HPB48_015662 [Haemaphysalis longicornis]|uniref:Uncharacterized protein n=1 Tax=Haemaphysalis longicornis TaxID=44386 RepID=A0A9J6GW54_HAELO|nr:hypothetical protein HPB48_015662 [Haemaphysalis longicornis]
MTSSECAVGCNPLLLAPGVTAECSRRSGVGKPDSFGIALGLTAAGDPVTVNIGVGAQRSTRQPSSCGKRCVPPYRKKEKAHPTQGRLLTLGEVELPDRHRRELELGPKFCFETSASARRQSRLGQRNQQTRR